MTPHIPEEISARLDLSPFVIMGNAMPPRDPDEDEEAEEEEKDDDEEEEEDDAEDPADDPRVLREPGED